MNKTVGTTHTTVVYESEKRRNGLASKLLIPTKIVLQYTYYLYLAQNIGV